MNELPDRALKLLLAWPGMVGRRLQGVWLFGSQARGEATEQSDIDLAVLCDPPLGLDRTRAMDVIGLALCQDVDVIDLRTAPPPLAWEVVTTGRLLVEPDELAVEAFVRRARFAVEDWDQRSRMILLAQTGDVGGVRR